MVATAASERAIFRILVDCFIVLLLFNALCCLRWTDNYGVGVGSTNFRPSLLLSWPLFTLGVVACSLHLRAASAWRVPTVPTSAPPTMAPAIASARAILPTRVDRFTVLLLSITACAACCCCSLDYGPYAVVTPFLSPLATSRL